MSDTKLDQSLDEIVGTQRSASGRGRGRARGRAGRVTQTARANPAGGIKKTIRATRGTAASSAPSVPTPAGHGDRIQVSNLPKDVTEAQIKEYFVKSAGPIKRVEISYGPGGVSRGIATVAFRNAQGAQKAVQVLNGVLVDGRPIKIDIILDSRQAATIVSRSLSERMAPSKTQPKSVESKKTEPKGASNAASRAKKGKKPRSARPAKKTAEELDSEMADYFVQGSATENGTTAAAAPASGEAMEEVL